jgi:Type IV pilus assembly protein PilM
MPYPFAMLTTIEVSGHAIRLIRVEQKRIAEIESYPIPKDADPLQALENAPLPSPLGKVRVVIAHGDMLLRTMLQPPSPPERLDRLVHFELQSNGEEPTAVSWHLVQSGGADDMRLLTMTTKQKLITQIKSALAKHGGKLVGLTHPTIGLYESYCASGVSQTGHAILADVGGQNVHIALVIDGELVFVRNQSPGMDELVRHVAELRTLSESDASELVAKLGKGAPADLHEVIKRQVGQVANMLTANVRFAKAQLKIDSLEPKTIYLTGAGAQVHGFIAALSERMGMPVHPINPFAGTIINTAVERLDRKSALPSGWAIGLGLARTDRTMLDALTDERGKTTVYWRTVGALRIAAAAMLALFVLAIARQEMNIAASNSSIAILEGEDQKSGLVPVAKDKRKNLDDISTTKGLDTSRLAWIDSERRPGRIALELLSAIALESNPTTCPVFLQSYKVERKPGLVTIIIQGHAEGIGKLATDSVLHNFEQGLIKRYPPIVAIKQIPKPIDSARQQFHYELTVTDQPADVKVSDGKSSLDVSVNVPAEIDAEGAARVAAIRARTNQSSVTVSVSRGSGQAESKVINFKN